MEHRRPPDVVESRSRRRVWQARTGDRFAIGIRGTELADLAGLAPAQPVGLVLVDATGDSVTASWIQPPGPVTTYTVAWREVMSGQGADDNWTEVTHTGTGADSEYTVGGLPDRNTEYEVRVKAINGIGESGWSAVAAASTNNRKPNDDIELHADNAEPTGIWSDGTTLWVADAADAVLYRYNLADGAYLNNTFATTASPASNEGVWSNGETVWVLTSDTPTSDGLAQGVTSRCGLGACVLAYDAASGRRQGLLEIDVASVAEAAGLWADGAVMWVAGSGHKAYAFDMATRNAVSAPATSRSAPPTIRRPTH